MNKMEVMKALELCVMDGFDSCKNCPYKGMPHCDKKMTDDALALLKEKEAKASPKYTCATIFTKKGNLSKFLHTYKEMSQYTNNTPSKITEEFYAKERDIELILLSRMENGKVFCKIKCPVNPLPIKGEFEVPGFGVIQSWLYANGWEKARTVYPNMFN